MGPPEPTQAPSRARASPSAPGSTPSLAGPATKDVPRPHGSSANTLPRGWYGFNVARAGFSSSDPAGYSDRSSTVARSFSSVSAMSSPTWPCSSSGSEATDTFVPALASATTASVCATFASK